MSKKENSEEKIKFEDKTMKKRVYGILGISSIKRKNSKFLRI